MYVYIYICVLSSRFFLCSIWVETHGTGQSWGSSVAFRTAVGEVFGEKKLQFSRPIIPIAGKQWKPTTFSMSMMSTFRIFQTFLDTTELSCPPRSRISLCLQDASLGGRFWELAMGARIQLVPNPVRCWFNVHFCTIWHYIITLCNRCVCKDWGGSKLKIDWDWPNTWQISSAEIGRTGELWGIEPTESDLSMKGQDRHSILSQ